MEKNDNKQVLLDVWKTTAETYYNAITGVRESLTALDKDYLSIDRNALTMCSDMLRNYIDKLECRKDVAPVVPPELQVVISLLDKLTVDMDIVRDAVADYLRVLSTE